MRTQILLGLVFLFVASAASAEEVHRAHHNANVSAGREGRLGYYASPDAKCGAGMRPQIEIVERPNYGTLSVRPDRLTAYASTVPPRANGCRGKFVDAIAVYYKPAAGFHGSDRLTLRVRFPAANAPASTLYDTIFISVR